MSGLGLLATAFGSYASTLGGLYKEQVEKEQAAKEKERAAKEKLEAEEREFKRQVALKELDNKFELNKIKQQYLYNVELEKARFDNDLKRAAVTHEYNLARDENGAWRAVELEKLKHELELDKLRMQAQNDMIKQHTKALYDAGNNREPASATSARINALVQDVKSLREALRDPLMSGDQRAAIEQELIAKQKILNDIYEGINAGNQQTTGFGYSPYTGGSFFLAPGAGANAFISPNTANLPQNQNTNAAAGNSVPSVLPDELMRFDQNPGFPLGAPRGVLAGAPTITPTEFINLLSQQKRQ